MKQVKIEVGLKQYNVSIAETDEEKEIGLQDIENLPEDEGMLFVFNEPDEVSMWMKDTKIPLDIIFIDEDLNVISVHEGTPNSEELITEQNVLYVLELNKNSGVKETDELDFISDTSVKSDKMIVLDANGKPQMKLDGGERIFSRPNTKVLIKFAKKAFATNNDKDYKALGKRVFKFLKVQNESEDQYVELKN